VSKAAPTGPEGPEQLGRHDRQPAEYPRALARWQFRWNDPVESQIVEVEGYDMIRYDTMHYIYVRPKADKASLICRVEPNKNSNEEN